MHATPKLNCMVHTPYSNSPNFIYCSLADNMPNVPTTKVSLHMVKCIIRIINYSFYTPLMDAHARAHTVTTHWFSVAYLCNLRSTWY